MKLIKTTMYSTLLTLLLSANALADCSYELFSISSTKNTKIIDFIEQLSDECEFSIIVTDPNAQKFLDTNLNKTNLNNLTINEVLDLVLKENNLNYSLENNILKVSYLATKMFNIDYILSQRKSESKTNITLSSEGAGVASQTGTTTSSVENEELGGGAAGKSGMQINSTDEVEFWNKLDLEFQEVLNRPQDVYVAQLPIINKNAGIITVTATVKQMERFERYLEKLQDKVQLQVLIDVQLLSVTLSDGKTTGVDWSQLYALQDIDLSIDKLFHKNISEFEDDKITTAIAGGGASENSHLIKISASGNLNEVIKFLKTQGDVTSISNPKVLTLNNQAALITAGTEYFYKIISTETLSGTTSGTQSTSEDLQSVFAGVLLDITPEISDDNMITLKINPSLSETATDISQIEGQDRTMPPDLRRRQLSSVVTVKDGNRIILGGLINTSNSINVNKVPILGDIPVLNYLFRYENKLKITQELVIVIEPHIIRKGKENLSLSDLGYEGLSESIMINAKEAIKVTTTETRGKLKPGIYENSRDVFLDTVNVKDYIQLEKISMIYQALRDSIEKPLKMVLLYGKPGTGKSMFLSKLHEDVAPSQKAYLYKTPILDESEFFKTLAQDLYGIRYDGELNFTQFMKVVENRELIEAIVPIIMLDEAQLYTTAMMEKIRLLSDTRKVKFVIALHKTEKEDIIAKEHFQTRIWESIKLENASPMELKIYIQKKLMKVNCVDTASMFMPKSINLIHKLTDGNYRDTNKLVYTLFDIYHYYAQNNPKKIKGNEISKKIIEMAAIHTGLINA